MSIPLLLRTAAWAPTADDSDSVQAWITMLDGTFVGYLERSPTSLIRHVSWSIELNKPGVASFEYHRTSQAIIDDPALVALDSLLWIAYRGVTRVYVLEQRTMQLDAGEESTGWFTVAGRGVLQLLGDRIVFPDGFTGTEQPDAWTDQWHTITSTPVGEALWSLIDDSNTRPDLPQFVQITEGTIETTAGDEWTQQLRFQTVLDVVNQATQALGDVDMDGLAFNYYNALGSDLSGTIIFEEGADVLRATRETTKAESTSWIVAEGVGEGVFAKIAVAKDATVTRRREAFLDAKDAGNTDVLQIIVDGALDEHNGATDRIGFDLLEEGIGGRHQALRDFYIGDTVRVIASDAGLDDDLRIVALYFAESDQEIVRVSMDVNDQRTEHLLKLAEGNEATARSIGVQNRMPQGQLVPWTYGPDSGPLDSDVPYEFPFKVPSRIFLMIEITLDIRLREFQATSRAAIGATSGSSSASTTEDGGGDTKTTTDGGSQSPTSSSGGSQTPTSGSSSASTTASGGSSTPTSGASSASTTNDGGAQTSSSNAASSSKSTADADGGQTSSSGGGGSSSASTTDGGAHQHVWASGAVDASPYVTKHLVDGPGTHFFNLDTDGSTGFATADDYPVHDHGMAHNHGTHTHTVADHSHGMAHTHSHSHTIDDHHHGMAHTHDVTISNHTHGMTHTHDVTISAHTHTVTIVDHDHAVTIDDHSHGMEHTHVVPALDLDYGMFEESMPASWSVTPTLYSVSGGGSLTLEHTFDPITDELTELDLIAHVTTAGRWLLRLQSDAAQPNNGRLVAQVYGAAIGAISSAR